MQSRLVLLAHGSNDPVWCETFEKLLGRVGVELGSDRVRLAYMQFAQPTIEQIAAEAEREGVQQLKLMPLFLSDGGHVRKDLPRLVEETRIQYPGLRIQILSAIGENPAFTQLVVDWARQVA